MTDWRQKLTVDWPCAAGDWLWDMAVVKTAEALDQMSFPRMMMLAGLALLVIAFAQVFTVDIAIVFAGDAMTWFEVVSAVMLIVARGHVIHGWRLVVNPLKDAMQRHRQAWQRRPRTPHRLRSLLRQAMDRLTASDDGDAPRPGGEMILAFG